MQITNYRDVVDPNKPSIVGEFDFYHAGKKITICGWKAIRSKKGSVFPAAPSYCRDHDGAKKYYPIVVFNDEDQKELDSRVREELKIYVK